MSTENKENENLTNESGEAKENKAKKVSTKKNLTADKADEYIAKLNEDLEEQKRLADEYYDSLKRNMADFDNYKKRIVKEKETLHTVIVADIVENMLPILDNFDTALSHDSTDEKFKTGMEMIYSQIKEVISKYGVEEIQSLNCTFDPMLHEAVMHEDNEEYGEKEIIEVFRKGYKIKDKVIRHAMVKVAN